MLRVPTIVVLPCLLHGAAAFAIAGRRTPTTVVRSSSVRLEYRTMAGLIQIEQDEESVGRALCETLKLEAAIAIAATGRFSFAISGGSMLKMLSNLADDASVEWEKCSMYFVSHRCVPLSSDGATASVRGGPRSPRAPPTRSV